jgi:biotin synthase-related radical SAM superfamily protein
MHLSLEMYLQRLPQRRYKKRYRVPLFALLLTPTDATMSETRFELEKADASTQLETFDELAGSCLQGHLCFSLVIIQVVKTVVHIPYGSV